MKLSVIIVSYNVKYFLEQCLHSVLAACININAEIIVIDNVSSDNSINYLKPKFPEIIFIENDVNSGFAKANNKALKAVKGNYILYLNPDTILCENIITNCISFLDENKKAGAAGVKMIDANGNFLPESKRAFPSVMASFFKLSGLAFLFPQSQIFNKYALANLDENKVHIVDVLSGAFFISRKEILLSLNGFDEDFFMYGEDIDLGYRIVQAGYKNYYLGNNTIIHFKGESTLKDSAYVKNFYGAMKIFVHKHHKKIPSFFLKAAITTGAMFSLPVKKIKLFFTPAKKEKNNKNFILLGNEVAVKSASVILKANNYLHQFFIIEKNIMLNDKLLKNVPSKSNVIFCVSKLSYSSCMQFVQDNKSRFIYFWHYEGSESIISGSNATTVSQIYITI